MTLIEPTISHRQTMEDLLHELGDIPAGRVLLDPPPGKATEADVLWLSEHEDRLCELVDGVLVEKAMGFRESTIAIIIATALRAFVAPRRLGIVSGADGLVRLARKLVRIPDVAFVSWGRIPGGRFPKEPIPQLALDLAVEVLSAGNSEREMERKLEEYFAARVRLVWIVDPRAKSIAVYSDKSKAHPLVLADTLTGGDVLPGFTLNLAEIFAEPSAA
jgi:Uma2 family endonuclease